MPAYGTPYVTAAKSFSYFWTVPSGFSVQSSLRSLASLGISITEPRVSDPGGVKVNGRGSDRGWSGSILSDWAGWDLGIKPADKNQNSSILLEEKIKMSKSSTPTGNRHTSWNTRGTNFCANSLKTQPYIDCFPHEILGSLYWLIHIR